MLERKSNVMLRFTESERDRLDAAWKTAMANAKYWERLAFATWLRRTVLNLVPEKTANAAPKRKRAA